MMPKPNDSLKGRLFVISGPSGTGKSTLARELINTTNAQLSISATSRPPGCSEKDGRDYYFLTEQEFEDKIKKGEFLEYARVFDHYYGTPAEPVLAKLAAGQIVILEIDIQGAEQIFRRFPEAVGILVLPPSREELQRRLRTRKRDDDTTIQKRLEKAQWEIDQARSCSNYRHFIVNDDLEQAKQEIVKIIQSAAQQD